MLSLVTVLPGGYIVSVVVAGWVCTDVVDCVVTLCTELLVSGTVCVSSVDDSTPSSRTNKLHIITY